MSSAPHGGDPALTADVAAPVLGQLLLLQSVVAQLPDEQKILDFVCRGIESVPGVRCCVHGPSAETHGLRLQLRHNGKSHGTLVVAVRDQIAFAPYEPYLKNLAFMLGIILDERRQRSENERYQAELENLVEERTQELRERVAECASSRDSAVTERQRAERYLQVAEAMIVELDKAGRIETANHLACQVLGHGESDLRGRDWFEVANSPEQREQMRRAFERIMAGEMALERYFENEVMSANGALRRIHWHNELLRDAAGNIVGTLSSGRDVTERRRAEQDLRRSEWRFRRMAEVSPFPIVIVHVSSTRLEYWNPSFSRLFGYSHHDVRDVAAWMRLAYPDPACREEVQAQFSRDVDRLAADQIVQREYRVRCADGQDRDVLWSLVAFDEHRCLVFADDLTERKAAAQEHEALLQRLHRARKMEALGLLAGGVAHDLNNVLSGIIGYPELLLLSLPEDNELREPLEIILESGRRAADIVKDLLTVARGSASARKVTSLNRIVDEYLSSAECRELRVRFPGVALRTALAEDVLPISCSAVHVHKSLVNLVNNAAEAIDGDGTVRIATYSTDVDRPLRGYDDVDVGEYSVLEVSDDGPGISATDRERIFEPFYTKKIMGRSGTGLGLAVVWNTVQDHEGYVELDSSPQGTRFQLYFPATREAVEEEAAGMSLEGLRGRGERVFVIDDEPVQRRVASRMLESLGYRVQTASSGEEALEVLSGESFDVLLLDMIMPGGMGGRETYTRIAQEHPGQKAVIASGYAETDEVRRAQELGAGDFLRKPYALAELAAAVRRELER